MISRAEFARRRRNLMAQMEPNSIAIVAAARQQRRSRDTFYRFRQDSDFYYLSGFDEPEALLALLPGREQGQFVLFCRERNATAELWDGARLGPEGVIARLDADDAFPVDDIDDILPGLIEGRERVYYPMGHSDVFDHQLVGWVNSIHAKAHTGAVPPGELTDLGHMLHDMRLVKSAGEQRLLRKAGDITAQGHCAAMRACRAGLNESDLEAELAYHFARAGSKDMAYTPIVGGGKNAGVLHYSDNNASLRDGDLVLIDAGCEYAFYAADVTRTFPVNGRFTAPQKAIYEIVLAAQNAALAAIAPGRHWNEAHEASERVITEGLLDLGILKGELNALLESGACGRYYMHKVGHWLGMDVHDVGEYRVNNQWRVLEPGMVMTVEPGIYIAADDKTVAGKWRGISVRIEDNVIVTRDGCDLISDGVPREVTDIEALMSHG